MLQDVMTHHTSWPYLLLFKSYFVVNSVLSDSKRFQTRLTLKVKVKSLHAEIMTGSCGTSFNHSKGMRDLDSLASNGLEDALKAPNDLQDALNEHICRL